MSRTARRRLPTLPVRGRPGSGVLDLDHALAVTALACGLLALALLALDVSPRIGTWLGLIGVLAGLWGQMVSRTTGERFADVAGLVASAVALAVGASLDGLW